MRLGIDIGGTTTEAALVDEQGIALHRLWLPTGHGQAGVIDSTNDAIFRVVSEAGRPLSDVIAAGIGIPGRVDRTTGVVTHAVNLGFETLNVGKVINDKFGFAVQVDNDVNAAALGVWHQLSADPTSNHFESMAYLNLGTGLAAGIVLSGQLWRGARGTAGEIGHISVDATGPLCACGQHGCLEAVASGSAVARQWRSKDPELVQALYRATTEGDPLAKTVWSSFLRNVAAAVRVLMLTVDVDVVVIGGGVSKVGAPLLDGVKRTLKDQADQSRFLSFLNLADRVQLAPEDGSAAVGAAMMVTQAGVVEQAARS